MVNRFYHWSSDLLPASVIDRLTKEGISSTEQLANADPIRLLLRTSIEWKTILYMIDGTLLFNYLGEKASVLRKKGFRTTIELAELGDEYKAPTSSSELYCV